MAIGNKKMEKMMIPNSIGFYYFQKSKEQEIKKGN